VQLQKRKSLVALCKWLQALCTLSPERLRKSWALHKLLLPARRISLPQAMCKSVLCTPLMTPRMSLEQQQFVPHMSQQAEPLAERLAQNQFDQ
jgi:hypothetical protein